MSKPYLTYEQRLEIYKLSEQGIPQKEIAKKFDVSVPTICRIATEAGIYRLNTKGKWRRNH
jgi:transposase